MRVAVLGVGLIGGSIGLALKEKLEDVEVYGYDPSSEALTAAEKIGAIDRSCQSEAEALEGAELAFVATPVGVCQEAVERTLSNASDKCIVTDVGSTKGALAESINDKRFVGGHPLAGREVAGVENARSDLFKGATWYLTPSTSTSGFAYERLHRVLTSIGAKPVAIEPEAHDKLLAAISHLPHVVANQLAAQVAGQVSEEDRLPPVGPSFRDATRVAGANSGIWVDIYRANAKALTEQIDQLIESLTEVRSKLAAGDREEIQQWNDQAAEYRRRLLERNNAGDGVFEIRVAVPNKPGVVAEIALKLGSGGVNILDLALHPAADMSSGTVALWVAGDKDTELAMKLLDELGFPVSKV